MREMKDSGIEWIGEIPADWETRKIKQLADSNTENSFVDGDWIESPYIADCGIRYLTTGNIGDGVFKEQGNGYITLKTFKELACKYAFPGDLIISRLNAPYGRSCILPSDYTEYVVAVDNVILRTQEDKRYICYVSQCDGYKHTVEDDAKGTTMKRISRTNLGNIVMPLPPIQQQHRIADYLDRKCSQIDAIIARQQEVIEKLKAYKLSIITEAVTKGLDPDVPMKDSGVEWIGEIPEHWDFRRIKNCCLIVDCKNRTPDPEPDGEYIVVRTTCIRDGSFSYEGSYHTNAENFKEWNAKGQPQHGDIFFTREAPMGEACLVPDADKLCMGQRVMFFRPLDGSDPRYILYSIYGPLAREYIDSKNKGSTVGHLKLGQVASLPLFYCPPREQNEIANYLDKRCGAIDKVVEKKAEIILRLTDYKKSLIYEVVTGKKEV